MLILKILINQSTLNGAHVIQIAKTCIAALMKARNFLICQCIEECVNWNKVEDGEEIFFKALAN